MMRPDWDKITEEAFNSEEVHDFSADYCRRRAELQGGTSMEKRRITQKTRRFNTRIAATAAALLIIPTATVGALHFAPSGDKNDGKKLGAAVEEATALTEGDETSAATEPETQPASEAPTEPVTEPAGKILGDYDGNGKVDIFDATALQRKIARVPGSGNFEFVCGDVDGDGHITIFDVTYIMRYMAHMDVPYAVNEPITA